MPPWMLALALSVTCGTGCAQSAVGGPAAAPEFKVFQDAGLGITYRYAAYFLATEAAAEGPGRGPACVRAPLSAGVTTALGSSTFVLSVIGPSCPDVLARAQALAPFTRTQIVHQLERYGIPSVTQEPQLYLIEGHAAAVTLADARSTPTQVGDVTTTTYAAKVCVQTDRVLSGKGGGLVGTPKGMPALREILCFDFTTVERKRLTEMLSFPIEVEGRGAQPLVPAGVLH